MEILRLGWKDRQEIWSRLNQDMPSQFDYDFVMERLISPTSFVVGCFIEKKLAGLLFTYNFSDFGYIMSISVDKEWKRKGIGKKMLHFLLEKGDSTKWWCKIHKRNEASIQMFQSCGFIRKRKKDYPLKKKYGDDHFPYCFEREKKNIDLN